LADGWQYAYQEPLQNNINSIFYCQEYIDFDQAKPTKFSQHNRQYKSKNSPFRLYTRGYISGIVAVPTPKISAASLEASYQSTWCLQVDLCQQYSDSIKEISQPLLLRHQRSNPCIPEYSTIQGRSLFAAVKDEFFHLASKNIQKFYSGHYKPITRLTQSSTGEIAPLLTRDTKAPKVSVVIPFRDQVDLLEMCIKSLLANEKICELELLLADNGSVEDATRKLIEELTSNTAVNAKHIRIDEPFNFSRINNIAAAHFTGDYILLLNNDIEFRSINPIASMASYFLFNNIGAVGSRLLYEDGSIQHQGIVITPFEPYDTYSPFKNTHQSEYDYSLTSLVSADQWSAATAACLLIDRDTWINSQGLDENLVVAYNDIDLCLRICESGKAVLVDPSPSIIHFESKSRGHDLTGYKYNRLYQEAGILRSKHAKAFSAKDEFWPQLLSISNPRATPAYLDAPELASFDSPLSIIKRTEGLRQVDKQAPLNVCIYVNYNASNRLRPDIIWQLEELSKHYAIIFVTTCSLSLENDPLFELLTKHTHRILFRENIGYDFGSWKCGILDTIDLIGDASSLLLMNDSLYGPITPMTDVIEHTLFAEEDFICMTLNNVGGAHAQSYFVSYKPSIFLSADFTAFWKTVPVYADKYQLIKNCEMNWSHFLLNTNKSLKALFDTGSFGNQTHVDWRKLILEYDCPFIKNELIHKNPVGQDINDIESILAANSILYKQMLAFWQETDETLAFTPCQSLASA
jgi:GT2 family glycosyltransferase